jgi:hypothetical protein
VAWLPAPGAAKRQSQQETEAVRFDFAETGRGFLVRAAGLHGYPYWLRSDETFDLGLGHAAPWPVGTVQLHSVFLHEVGPERAVEAAVELLRRDVLAGDPVVKVSRADVYASTPTAVLLQLRHRPIALI